MKKKVRLHHTLSAPQGNVPAVYLRNLQQVLHSLLLNNPSWLHPTTVKRYFSELLQCPQCKRGLWPFIQTIIRYSQHRRRLTWRPDVLMYGSVEDEYMCIRVSVCPAPVCPVTLYAIPSRAPPLRPCCVSMATCWRWC